MLTSLQNVALPVSILREVQGDDHPDPGGDLETLLTLLSRQDERILHAVVLRRWDPFDRLMRAVTHAGDAWLTIAVTLALLLGAVPPLQDEARHAAFALVVSHLGVQLLKRTITRQRPRLPVGYDSLIEPPDRFSFPSGHAAASLSLALPLAAAAPPVVDLPLMLFAGLVGISRCYLGVHYPGDVVMGWLLAAVAALAWSPLLGMLGG